MPIIATHPSLTHFAALAGNCETTHLVTTELYEQFEGALFGSPTPLIAPAAYMQLIIADSMLAPAIDGLSRTRTEHVLLDATTTPWIILERVTFQNTQNTTATTVLYGVFFDPITHAVEPFEEKPMISEHECNRIGNIIGSWIKGIANAQLTTTDLADAPRKLRKAYARFAPPSAKMLTAARILTTDTTPARILLTSRPALPNTETTPWRVASALFTTRQSARKLGIHLT